MNLRRLLAAASILAICGALLYRPGSAAPPSSDSQQESIEVRYARVQLRLAELTLQKAQEMNKKVPGTLIAGLMTLFTDNVEIAKKRLEGVMAPDGYEPLQACIQRAILAQRSAENKLKRATEANQRSAGLVSANELERLALEVEIAKLRIERGRALANASSDAKLQWQIDLLNEDLSRIAEQTYLLGQNRLQQF